MDSQNFSVGLDIGTTKIMVVVGRKNNNGKIELMGIGRSKSTGIKKGTVNNVEQTIQSIREAVAQAEASAGVKITKVTVGIAGKHIRSLQHSDYIMRDNPDQYITTKDIELLKNQVKKLVMLPGEEIIHVLPQEYKVDSENEIQEPVGMHGKRLEAIFHVVVGQMASIKNITRCVQDAGLEMQALTLEPLAAAEAVLTPEEKEAGVAIVDIGGGTTDIAIFKDNVIRHTCVIPYGGNIITEDIKAGCTIIEQYAEKLKVKFGSAMPDLEKETDIVTIPGLYGRNDREISLKTLSNVINARIQEILELVNIELRNYGAFEQKKKLIAGIVLTGGGAKLKNLKELVNLTTGLEARIGVSNEYVANDNRNILNGPHFATSIGLLMESIRTTESEAQHSVQNSRPDNVTLDTSETSANNSTIDDAEPSDKQEDNPLKNKNAPTDEKATSFIKRFMDKFRTLLEDNE